MLQKLSFLLSVSDFLRRNKQISFHMWIPYEVHHITIYILCRVVCGAELLAINQHYTPSVLVMVHKMSFLPLSASRKKAPQMRCWWWLVVRVLIRCWIFTWSFTTTTYTLLLLVCLETPTLACRLPRIARLCSSLNATMIRWGWK